MPGTDRQKTAYDYRMAGYTWKAIGKSLGVGAERARQLAHSWQYNNIGYIRNGTMKRLPCCPHTRKSSFL